MRGPQRIVLGTRGSELARAQTRLVEQALRNAFPELNMEVRVITTTGDEGRPLPNEWIDPRAGRKGVFTREIEQALERGEIDVAVHSAKDLPSDAPDDLEICATLPRAAVEDVLLFKEAADLNSLPRNAIVATGSVRRQHQLRWKRADLRFVDLRGNVPTRLRKLVKSDWNAIILARAGLERLGYNLSNHALDYDADSLHVEFLSSSDFLPAGGQGVIAIQARSGDKTVGDLVVSISDSPTLLALRAEREFLRLLQADCNSPVGVLATIDSQVLTLRAQVFETTNVEPKMGEVRSSLREEEPETISGRLHALMYGQK
jgi:hydroxymethylbilane synthase